MFDTTKVTINQVREWFFIYLLNSATIKKWTNVIICLANKYGITTYLNFLSIDNFCSIKFNLLRLSELPRILDNKLSATITKDNQFSTQIQSYFLTSFSWAVVTFVVPNLSHSDYLNLPVTVDNKLLATKKKDQSYFCIFS